MGSKKYLFIIKIIIFVKYRILELSENLNVIPYKVRQFDNQTYVGTNRFQKLNCRYKKNGRNLLV